MREELILDIMNILISRGITDMDIKQDLEIALGDYEITARETAVAIRSEDKNKRYLERFLIAKTVQGCTDKTLQYYSTIIKQILDTIGKPADEISADDIRFYLALRDRRDHVSKITQDNELRCLRSFFKYLHGEELVQKDPTVRIGAVKGPKMKKAAFTEMEVEMIRNACKNSKEKALVELLLSTGCRSSEVVSIKISEIDGEKVVVRGKGNKYRVVFLNAKAQLATREYISDRRDSNPYLFPKMKPWREWNHREIRNSYTHPENVLPDGHMDVSSVRGLLSRIGKRASVENVHPHRFRRTCATFALRRGMPIEQVSKMLGHEELGTTQIYLDLDEKDLELSHKKYVV